MKKVRFDLPKVREVRPMDLTEAEARALYKGKRMPLSARIGRGPMFVVPKAGGAA